MNKRRHAHTLAEVARLARTTKSTVSRVLANNPRISAETKSRVMEIVRKHDFHPNVLARALAKGRTGLIGVLASNISSGFFADVLRGIDRVAMEQKGHLLCSFAHGNEDYLRLWYELAREGQIEGLILIDPPLELFTTELRDPGIPIAICATRPEAGAQGWSSLDTATVNNRKAVADLVAHLYAQGCRTLTHLGGPTNTFDSRERQQGFVDTCRDYRDIRATVLEGHLIQEDGVRQIKRLLRSSGALPDAILAFNDSTALGVLEGVQLYAPERAGTFAVTGWDDTPAAPVIGLTSVRMPIADLGQACARLLFNRLAAPTTPRPQSRHVRMDCTIVPRASSTFSAKPSPSTS